MSTPAVSIPSYPDLDGKVAVVTGGSRGIGAATARALAASGVAVAIGGRDVAAIDAVVKRIRSEGGTAISAPADCTDFTAIEHVHAKVTERLGPVDVLAAFAGGGSQPVPIHEITEEGWHEAVDSNLTATFLTLKAFLPAMIEHGGSIITMASTAGRMPVPGPVAYAAAKAGILMLTRCCAAEYAARGVRANCISPGAVDTGRLTDLPERVREQIAKLHPIGRVGEPGDIASAALFLASDASSWITGVTLDVTGGRIML